MVCSHFLVIGTSIATRSLFAPTSREEMIRKKSAGLRRLLCSPPRQKRAGWRFRLRMCLAAGSGGFSRGRRGREVPMIERDVMSYRRRMSCRVAWQALWLVAFGCADLTDAQAGDRARTSPLPQPMALWSFEACGKSPIADDSRHGHVATGTMACAPGRFGSGARFDAARTGLRVAESPRFRARAALSIVTWIKVGQ